MSDKDADFETILVEVQRQQKATIAIRVPNWFKLKSGLWHPHARLLKPFFESLDSENLSWETLPERSVRTSLNGAQAKFDVRPYLSKAKEGGAK
jgi:hypothetical protein